MPRGQPRNNLHWTLDVTFNESTTGSCTMPPSPFGVKMHLHHVHDGTDGEKTGLSPLSAGVHLLSRSRSEPGAERLVGPAVAKRQGAAFDQQVDLIGREREPRRHRLQGGSAGWP
jgi:hypothetical protein